MSLLLSKINNIISKLFYKKGCAFTQCWLSSLKKALVPNQAKVQGVAVISFEFSGWHFKYEQIRESDCIKKMKNKCIPFQISHALCVISFSFPATLLPI